MFAVHKCTSQCDVTIAFKLPTGTLPVSHNFLSVSLLGTLLFAYSRMQGTNQLRATHFGDTHPNTLLLTLRILVTVTLIHLVTMYNYIEY